MFIKNYCLIIGLRNLRKKVFYFLTNYCAFAYQIIIGKYKIKLVKILIFKRQALNIFKVV